ncbi:SDR family NAD(P)-dependent oxidoreductase [Candidatus Woesearchaeota archaeon]|nr:SDR family NAD(P)-dependent oxidoreductase [Candidatus Woesearchaeota archaeon]
MFKGKVVLITGGTGYLGRSLIKALLKEDVKSIRVFSRDEVKHHRVQEMFNYDDRLRSLIGDVRDKARLKKAAQDVDIVIHAAALKRLDILEYNVPECIETNVNGTLNVVEACLDANVERAVFVSTDKACSPVNTYGACKFVGERIFSETNYSKGKKRTIFTCVRYGNVLESTGSVIPFFEKKLKDGEPITLTDKRMTRFIISPEEAVQLVFNALKYSVGGEVFVPRLPAFKITDLIEILQEKHQVNTGIKMIGLRPGEKIHEFMINKAEVPRTYEFKDMYVITSPIEKYQGKQEEPYVQEGRLLKEEEMDDYSSEDAVISKDEVKKLFKELELI